MNNNGIEEDWVNETSFPAKFQYDLRAGWDETKVNQNTTFITNNRYYWRMGIPHVGIYKK